MVKTTRWGILSTAQIGRKNWKAIHNSGNGTLVAVASRNVKAAQQFVDACRREAPMETHALGSYAELLAAPNIDAVYIPLPTGLRKEWVIRAAEAGKHILCEKPCAVSVADLREMLEACRRNRVQFMDGVMFMHSRRLERMREVLNDGASVGKIRRITSAFSFCAPDEFYSANIRAQRELEPAGCLGDLGWYCLRFALWVMQGRLPQSVTGRMLREVNGVPVEFSGELIFADGVSSGLYCSFVTHNEEWAQISGNKGYLQVLDFVAPFFGNELTFRVNNAIHNVSGCDFNMEAHWRQFSVAEYANSHPTAQETNMFRNFAAQVQSGKVAEEWPDWALKTQQLMEACLASARQGGREITL
jgi:predicted dehydrogenase